MNICSFVERNKDYITDILKNDNVIYCKAILIYKYMLFENIEYNEPYILAECNNILKIILEEFFKSYENLDEYDTMHYNIIIRKDCECMKKIHIIHYAINTP